MTNSTGSWSLASISSMSISRAGCFRTTSAPSLDHSTLGSLLTFCFLGPLGSRKILYTIYFVLYDYIYIIEFLEPIWGRILGRKGGRSGAKQVGPFQSFFSGGNTWTLRLEGVWIHGIKQIGPCVSVWYFLLLRVCVTIAIVLDP